MRRRAEGTIGPDVLRRARRGDHEAFMEAIGHYDRSLRALAYRLVGDRDAMDDALQETYIRAFRGLPGFRANARFGTWLYRIAYNACIDELRRRHTHVHVPLEGLAAGEAREEDPAAAVADRRDLSAALARLSLADRAAVLLVDAYGLEYSEAAEVLGVPVGTIGSRLSRARAQLRRVLQDSPKGVEG